MDQTFITLLTPPGRGAVATVLADGPQACHSVATCFQPARGGTLADCRLGRIIFGRWGGEQGEEIVVCRTSESRIEMHCHGGHVAAERILEDLIAQGCQRIEWPEFIASTTDDEIASEAAIALAQARTERTAGMLLHQYHGALRREVDVIRAAVLAGKTTDAVAALQQLIGRSWLGRHLTEPFRVVLAGPPNVGKSSLINALVGYQRAIVFDQPGTTRDVVTAATAIDGWPVELSDTAGLRTTADPLEAAGVALSHQQMATADCLLLIFDSSQPWTAADAELLAAWPAALAVHNKVDRIVPDSGRPLGLSTCAISGQGIEVLLDEISHRLAPEVPAPGAAIPFTSRQVLGLQRSLDALLSADVQEAAVQLQQIAALA